MSTAQVLQSGRVACCDPDCNRPAGPLTLPGRRFGFAGRMHAACYHRRVARAHRAVPEAKRPAVRHRQGPAPCVSPRASSHMPAWCPTSDQLDRMAAAAVAAFIIEAWGTAWASIALTAEMRPWDEQRACGAEAEGD